MTIQRINDDASLVRQADPTGVLTCPYYLPPWPVRQDTGDKTMGQLRDAAWAMAASLARDFFDELKRIANKQTLSDLGKLEARRAAAAPLLRRLDLLKNDLLGRAREQLVNREREIQVQPGQADVPTLLRYQAIWSWYQSLDKVARFDVVRQAMDEDDREALRALLTAPTAFRFVPPQIRDEIEATLTQRTFPTQTADLANLRTAISVAEQSIDGAVQFIREQTERPDVAAADHRSRLQAERLSA
jgi:hypothetical protein